ncbi:zinc-binding dehydrogenase [Rhodococcus sp. BP-316]|uniref:zinc-binding dehydrogenase n=1 Tax=Rhodococcus sp. BP-316 TaxID=2739445 RepID=UPI001C9A935D|nr:zinc-binding dehydrogenase [Rhodococcus sp. BP-316]
MTPIAAVWSGDRFSIRELPRPELDPGGVLVEVEMSTVCGSDRHTVAGHRRTPVPTVLGHESVGRVIEVRGDAGVAVGDRIVWTVGTACGACRPCAGGVPQKCRNGRKYGHERMTEAWMLNGGFASHVHLVSGTGTVVVPERLPAALAAPAGCATATVVNAARRVDLGEGDRVVVLGCGMLGLTAIAYARDRGAASIVACDPDADRRAAARELGADVGCAPEHLADAAATNGADAVFEMSGAPSSVSAALDVVSMAGRVSLVGSVFPTSPVSVDPERLVRELITVVGSHNYRRDDLVEAVAFLARTPAATLLADLVGPCLALADVGRAFQDSGPSSSLRTALVV